MARAGLDWSPGWVIIFKTALSGVTWMAFLKRSGMAGSIFLSVFFLFS